MKKLVSLLLVLVLALGMSTVAFAAKPEINKNPDSAPGFSSIDDTWVSEGLSGIEVEPGDSDRFAINQTLFAVTGTRQADSNADTAVGKWGFTQKDIRDTKLTVRTKVARGSSVLESCGIVYDKAVSTDTYKIAYVEWEYVEPFKSTKEVEFEFTIYPVVDGKAWVENGVVIDGTLANHEQEIYADDDFIDLEPGTIAVVKEYVKNVEYALGEGVSVFGRAIKGAKYWGVANKDASVKEDEMMVEKGIDEIYHLENIGLAGIASKVMLNDADPNAYVFDKNFKYLGKASEELPFADTYYLSNVMLDEDDGEEPDEDGFFDDDDIPVAPPITGGDGYPVENENDNPSTGK